MVRAYSKFTHYYHKVRAIGIARSVRTIGYKIVSHIKKGNSKQVSFFDAQNFTVPESLPFEINCSELISESIRFMKESILEWDADNDIRIVWERARFQQAPILAVAYKQTGDMQFLETIKLQITSWLDRYPYGHPVHWYNAMEVGLRSISWIIAVVLISQDLKKDQIFYRRILQSLYEHKYYIEHNWEWYDGRTSNHYLSNLVGYAYLCWFFGDHKKLRWSHTQLEKELDWQIFDEGSSYEGSTRYHVFVTELFVHGFLVTLSVRPELVEGSYFFTSSNLSVDQKNKLSRMLLFIEHCKISSTVRPEPVEELASIIIGDDDSGIVMLPALASLTSLAHQLGVSCNWQSRDLLGLHTYPEFGLSLYKSDLWHASLRHHRYASRQPSGHLHEDIGSVTIVYKGYPIIVDPGSYLYSSAPEWRNFFRSAAQHNTIHITNSAMVSSELFGLPRKQSTYSPGDKMETVFIAGNATVNRELSISDSITIIDSLVAQKIEYLTWNFIFAPNISVEYENSRWRIYLPDTTILVLESDLAFTLYDTWYAPSYGVKVKTVALRATISVDSKKEFRTMFRSYGSTGSPRTI